MDDAQFNAELRQLVLDYLATGCPCRYPRFRAVVARDVADVGAFALTSNEQQGLISLFEQLVPLRDKKNTPVGWRATCSKCGSEAELANDELGPGAWLRALYIRPHAEPDDIGEGKTTPLLRPKPLYAVGPKERGRAKAEKAFPAVSEPEWLLWMRERKAPRS